VRALYASSGAGRQAERVSVFEAKRFVGRGGRLDLGAILWTSSTGIMGGCPLTPQPRSASAADLEGDHHTMAKPTTTAKNKPLSKSDVLQAVTDAVGDGLSRKHAKDVVEALVAVGHKELKKSGVFVVPGFAKFSVVKKPAKPAREGINPFTKEKQMFAAKPASKGVRARAVKAIKDAVS
jgi:DNA-binding protein HU-beta